MTSETGTTSQTQPASSLLSPAINRDVEKIRLRFILGTLVLAVGLDILAACLHLGWMAAAGITYGLNAILLAFIVVRRDRVLGQLFVFGLAAGFTELPSDHFSVAIIKALVYAPGGPFIWTSPLYMPFSYVVVLVQIGYLGYRLSGRLGIWAGCGLTGLIGGLNVPLYEYLAKFAGYWTYGNCKMILDTVPYYIIVGEFLLALPLPLLVRLFAKARWPTIVALGVAEGVWMYVAWVGAYHVTG